MAEMEIKKIANKKTIGVNKLKKASTKVDLTPMVDLGFLLITFFMFTTTLSSTKAMTFNTPISDINDSTKVSEEATFTVLLAKDNKIFAHKGILKPDASNVLQYNYGNIREGLLGFKNGVAKHRKEFVNVIIKPSDSCTFENTINIIDEMTINGFDKYAKVNVTTQEEKMMETFGSY